jgi:hypothetical protein
MAAHPRMQPNKKTGKEAGGKKSNIVFARAYFSNSVFHVWPLS